MKLLVLIAVMQGACLVTQVAGASASVNSLISSMQDSFGGLSAQRNLWFDNYSNLKNLSQANELHLLELLSVSKMAVPLIWYLYKNRVRAQKNTLFRLVESGTQALPYHVNITAPDILYLHVEVTLLLHQEEDFQLKILRDLEQIFHLNFDFKERCVIMGNKDHEGEATERIVLEGEKFPAINLHEPFRVNVQVADDCIFASIWLRNLDLIIPMPLPHKYHWCTKVYRTAERVSVTVDHGKASSHSPEPMKSAEDAQEDNHDIQLVSTIIYHGLLTH